MKTQILAAIIAATVPTAGAWAQEVVITGFQNGHLTFTNSAPATQRFLYSVDWRPNLDASSSWTNSWAGLKEFSATNNVVTVDVPMFFQVAAYGDNLTTNASNWVLMYSNAMVDASIALPNKVCDQLTPVVLSNTNLAWRTNSDGTFQVKVVSFMPYSTATNYYGLGQHQLSYSDQWVTMFPELKNFCHDFQGLDQVLRIKQILGMPPTAANDTLVEFWVNPDYLFRPTPEPGIASTSAGVLSSTNAPLLSPNSRLPSFWPTWYNNTYWSRNYGMTNGVYNNAYPWTRLGYTYDWASTRPNHVGLSEFVIPSGTLWSVQTNAVPIEVEAVLPAVTYGKLD
ncbi:MAG: hypothetical protein ABSC03_05515 [Verrucomicrobiota bacterium]